jgi:hypothetical protein
MERARFPYWRQLFDKHVIDRVDEETRRAEMEALERKLDIMFPPPPRLVPDPAVQGPMVAAVARLFARAAQEPVNQERWAPMIRVLQKASNPLLEARSRQNKQKRRWLSWYRHHGDGGTLGRTRLARGSELATYDVEERRVWKS